jgi:hypothetical protein
MENGLEEIVFPVVLGEGAKVAVKILANSAPFTYHLTKNGISAEAMIEPKVGPQFFLVHFTQIMLD